MQRFELLIGCSPSGWRTSRSAGLVVLSVLVALAAQLAMPPPPAEAHAALESSNPAANAILPEAPDIITLRFTEPLERTYSTVELFDQDGNRIEEATVREGADEFEMVVELPPDLANGTYSVLWRTLSTADGHPAQNYFAFTIGTEDDVAVIDAPAEGSVNTGAPLWLQATSRWSALLGLAAAMAVWPIWLFVIRPAVSPVWHVGPEITKRVKRYAAIAILIAVVGNLFALLVQSAALDEGPYVEKVRNTLGDTRYGDLWFARVALLLIYMLALQWVAWWWPRHRAILANIALFLAIYMAIPFSYIAHASAQTTGRSAAIFNDFLHLLAASLWVGGLFAIVSVLQPSLRTMDTKNRRIVLSSALPRFSTVALIAWSTLILTGVYSSWLHVGSLDALFETDYGNALALKLLLLIPILLLATFNLFLVTRRLRQSATATARSRSWIRRFGFAVGTEAFIAVAVLFVVGSLTAQAPARETLTQQQGAAEVELSNEEHEATLTLTPGTPGPNEFDLTVADDSLPDETEVLLRLENQEQETGQTEIALERTGPNTFSYSGTELSIAGAWDIQLLVRPPGEGEWRLSATADIDPTAGATEPSRPGWVIASISGVFGMIMLLGGICCVVYVWQWRRLPGRAIVASAGALLLIGGAIAILQARTEPMAAMLRLIAG